jgi:hypothetical protein
MVKTIWQHLESCCKYEDDTKALAELEYREDLKGFRCGDLTELQTALRLHNCTCNEL